MAPHHHPCRTAHLVKRPGDPKAPQYYLVPELNIETLRFLAVLRSKQFRSKSARFFMVVGPQGSGKSQGLLAAAHAAGYHVAVVSPDTFSAETENGATTTLNDFMAEMQRYSAENCVYVLIILDDIDTSILARDEKTSVTPGHRMLAGRLQYIADHRDLYIAFDGSPLPVALTANRPDEIRASLLRHMRATWFEHNPGEEAKYDIVFQMLDPRSAEERRLVERLFAKYRRENLSFWSALSIDIGACQLDPLLADGLPDQAIIDAALARRLPFDADRIWALAKRRSSNRARNYFTLMQPK
jgi:hypothetical protein